MENKTWDKLHQPCPLCDSSDAVGINEDDSAKCFSCGEFMPSYDKACGGKDMQTAKTTTTTFKQPDMVEGGQFNALKDRQISQATATKYGVKSMSDYKVTSLSISIPTTMDMSYQLPRFVM